MTPPYIPATALRCLLLARVLRIVDLRAAHNNHGRRITPRGVWMPNGPKGDEGLVCWDRSSGTRERVEERVYAGLLAIDATDPGNQHAVADLLRSKGHEVGHLLPVALGGRQGDVKGVCDWCGGCREVPPSSPVSDGQTYETCSGCDRDGRVVIPAADVSAVLLAASVAGVEAGRGVVRGVLSAWDDSYGVRWDRHGVAVAVGDDPLDAEFGVPPSRVGWSVQTSPGNILAKGPETGPGGRAAADAALLRLGYAYLDPAAPFGVVVPFLRDGREVGS